MKRYRVEFTDEAKRDMGESYEWGCREWGKVAALRWYRTLRSKTREMLSHFPTSQPLAPESTEADGEIRQMIFGRYRVLYEIDKRTVRVLHIRGSFVGGNKDDLGVDE
jgi:plasmid stabilization system protein ParE